MTDPLDDLRRRVTFGEGDADDPPAASFDDVASDDRVFAPVGALHEDVRLDRADNLVRSVFVKDHHCIDRCERCEDLGAFVFRMDRAIGRLVERLDRSIAVDADDQQIAERPRVAKVANVARMEDVEHAIREHDDRPRRRAAATNSTASSRVIAFASDLTTPET